MSSTTNFDKQGTTDVGSDNLHLRPLGVDETFRRLLNVFGQRWKFFLATAAVAVVVQNIISWVLLATGALDMEHYGDTFAEYETIYEDIVSDENSGAEDAAVADNGDNDVDGGRRWLEETAVAAYDNYYPGGAGSASLNAGLSGYVIAILLFNAVLHSVVQALLNGTLIRTTAELYLSRHPSTREVLSRAYGRFVPLFGFPIVIYFGSTLPCIILLAFAYMFTLINGTYAPLILVGLVVLIILCLVAIGTYHTNAVIMVETMPQPRGIIGSISRSWNLSGGHRFYTLAVLVLFFVARVVLQIIFILIVMLCRDNQYVSMALNLVSLPLTTALGGILQTIVYFSVRAAKEGLSVDLLMQELQVDNDTPYQSMTTGSDNKMDMIQGNNTVSAVLDPTKETA